MPYKYAHERENYEMYASGSVLVSAPGHPAFPIRLANEIFRRCMAFREARGATGRCTLYDPCCGGAYHLTTMAFFNWAEIDRIIASDIDDDAVTVARRNLALLQPDGMARRIAEIEAMRAEFGKESHALALENAHTLAGRLTGLRQDHAVETRVFQADATDERAVAAGLDGARPDIVISDIPYGWHSDWHAESQALMDAADPIQRMLDALLAVIAPDAVVAIAAAKTSKIKHERYQRLERFQMGKRHISILTPVIR